MAGKQYSMDFLLNAQLGNNFNGAFKAAQSELAAMQKEIIGLSKTQSDISAYEKQQKAVESTQKKMEVLEQQYNNIQKEIQETEGFSASLENRLLSKQQQIDRTSVSAEQQAEKLNRMGAALKDAGVDTQNLTQESERLEAEMEDMKKAQEEAADGAGEYGSAAVGAFEAAGQALIAAGIAKALKEIADFYLECLDASIAFESGMTGVDKTTDLTAQELAVMSEEMKNLATVIPVTTDELTAIGETAGQLGIAKEGLLDFTEVMSQLSTATTMTAEEGATMLAQFANITQMDPTYYRNLASAIVDLGNNYATTEQKITDMSQGIAASASLAGMSEADMVGLSAAVTSLGIETQAGSTAMSSLIAELMTAVETGEGLEDFAEIANLSAGEFAKAWGTDAAEALEKFVVGLSDVERNGRSATVILSELGITETRMQRMVLSLANSGDLMGNAIETANKAWEENTALTAEAEKRYGTTASQITMLQNAYNNLQITIGDALSPAYRELLSAGTEGLKQVTQYLAQNPAVVKAVTVFVGVMATATAAIVAYSAAVKVAKALDLAAMFAAAGPALAVIAGVAALTAGIVAYAEGMNTAEAEIRNLSAASREQYDELKDLQAEYDGIVEKFDETHVEALLLREEVDKATAAFEENKQSAQELAEEHNDLMQSYQEMQAAAQATREEIDIEERSTYNLINRLNELMSAEGKTAGAKQEILNIVEILNEKMPELGLAYDQYADSLNLTTDAIRSLAEAELARERNAAAYDEYKTRLEYESKLQTDMLKISKEREAAEKKLATAQKAMAEARKSGLESGNYSSFNNYADVVGKAQGRLEDLIAKEAAANVAYAANEGAISALGISMSGYNDTQEAVKNGTYDMTTLMDGVTTQMDELSAAYEEAYNAAASSVRGQYNLWDEAASVQTTSIYTMNTNMQGQIQYWQNYNENLASLTERTSDIEGLSDVIASFADGSPEAVNAVAGMAQATDGELQAMVESFKSLETAKESTIENLAELNSGFSEKMAELVKNTEKTIQEMDMNELAAASGRNTIQAFIDAAASPGTLARVSAAYSAVAQAAANAINANTPKSGGTKTDGSHAGGLDYVPFDGYIAELHKGESVLTSQQAEEWREANAAAIQASQVVMFAPELMQQLMTVQNPVSVTAASPVGGGGIVIAPVYNLGNVSNPEQVRSVLDAHTEGLRDMVLEIIENESVDARRRSYD